MKLRLTITAALIALAPAVSATTIYNTGTLTVSYTHLTLPTIYSV